MSQTIPLSRITTPRSSSPYIPAPDSPGQAEFQTGLAYDNADEARAMPPSWQKDLYMLVEQPTSSQAAFLVHIFTTSLIIVSAVVTVLETVPAFHSIPGGVWFGLETTLVVLFTIEYIARCVAHGTSWTRFFQWVIYLLGILPYYIEIALQQDTSIPAAGWFVLVTITTVGYGEITPRSFLGRLITLPLLVFGLLLIALPTFVLGREFSLVWELMEEHQAYDADEDVEPANDPLASPMLSRSRSVRDLATTTGLWQHAQEEITRARRVSSNHGQEAHAHTQAELTAQIAELRAKVDAQEHMLRRIMAAVEGHGSQDGRRSR
ncbi:hypothetical protein BN946_scf184900.g6 [Trametes cinnabarina]|uniref:Potassium channel domain-containing protein n=1 Tax=Pycnoporus cinnabarinus TaxID=5643 RepID=A0A060SNX7_PYCCI|nr:hypothetical protein BN946_scf184900.g6 [Trametes cinnabarina]